MFNAQEWSILGFDANDATGHTVPTSEQEIFILPGKEVHDVLGRVAEADRALSERFRTEISSDPLVTKGLLDEHTRLTALFGGLCAVRNQIQGPDTIR